MSFDFDALHRSVVDYFESRGMRWGGFGFGEKPAVLIIDMAYGWTDPQYPAGSLRVSQAVDWIVKLLEVARPRGVPIVYTTSPRPYCLFHDCDIDEEEKKALAETHRSSKIDERITPQPEDKVLYKTGASAFFNTDLFRHLKLLDVDTLLITGCSTSACVKTTVMDAEDYGLQTVLVRQCINDRSETEHEWHIRDLTRWADAVDFDDAVEYLKG
jgi:nicotinamidase-related amidase